MIGHSGEGSPPSRLRPADDNHSTSIALFSRFCSGFIRLEEQSASLMSGRFLDNVSLATLLAPLPEQEFLRQHWEQSPLLLRRNDRDYYGDLLTLDDFDHHIAHAQAV